jgi:hypothetical protein
MSVWLNLLNAVVSAEAWTSCCYNFYRQIIVTSALPNGSSRPKYMQGSCHSATVVLPTENTKGVVFNSVMC